MDPAPISRKLLRDLARNAHPSSALSQRTREVLDDLNEEVPRALPPNAETCIAQILERIKDIYGWLSDADAELLIATSSSAIVEHSDTEALIEIGSYCGRSTCLIASVIKALGGKQKLYAIDPHEGEVGDAEQGVELTAPTRAQLEANLDRCGLTGYVAIIQAYSWEVSWDRPISLLFVDGLHDYENVARDFHQFEAMLRPAGYAAFHDYGGIYPGVTKFVDELSVSSSYDTVQLAGSLYVMRKVDDDRVVDQTNTRS